MPDYAQRRAKKLVHLDEHSVKPGLKKAEGDHISLQLPEGRL